MYKYDSYDQAMVDTRVEEFRDQTRRRLEGTLAEDNFRPLRLQNGLYLQLHAYMLRVAVPYGTLSSAQMRMLGDIADKYDRGYGHFTTRQNIQYNWIKLEDAPDILADLAAVEMHAIQTSGNCIRNISSDQYAGAAKDELVDPRPYAELLRQWSSFHPEFLALPRKFKIAVIASDTDRAAMRLHDIGIQMVKNDKGEIGCAFYVGGGAGVLVGADVADAVAAGLDGVHLHRRQVGQDVGRLFQLDPVVLDVLARGEVAIAAVILVGDVAQHAHLRAAQRAIGHGDAQHIGVELQVEPVLQAQRAELFLGQRAVDAAAGLVAEFLDAGVDHRLVVAVVLVHVRSPS